MKRRQLWAILPVGKISFSFISVVAYLRITMQVSFELKHHHDLHTWRSFYWRILAYRIIWNNIVQ